MKPAPVVVSVQVALGSQLSVPMRHSSGVHVTPLPTQLGPLQTHSGPRPTSRQVALASQFAQLSGMHAPPLLDPAVVALAVVARGGVDAVGVVLAVERVHRALVAGAVRAVADPVGRVAAAGEAGRGRDIRAGRVGIAVVGVRGALVGSAGRAVADAVGLLQRQVKPAPVVVSVQVALGSQLSVSMAHSLGVQVVPLPTQLGVLHLQSKPAWVSVQVALASQLSVLMAHSLGVQLTPLPTHCGASQAQVNDAAVSVQCACSWQLSVPCAHSLGVQVRPLPTQLGALQVQV